MEKEDFVKRLVKLRVNKGVSARDMSLSIGQSPSYINNIENGVNLPSMTVFFYICEYFGITPQEFFDTKSSNPKMEKELLDAVKGLSNEQLELLIAIANGLKAAANKWSSAQYENTFSKNKKPISLWTIHCLSALCFTLNKFDYFSIS